MESEETAVILICGCISSFDKLAQAKTQIITSSANLGVMPQLQTKHRQCDGVTVNVRCSCKNIKVRQRNSICYTVTAVEIRNLGRFMDLWECIFDKPLYLTFVLALLDIPALM